MYLLTNRKLTNSKGIKAFGKTPNPKGANELRLVKVAKNGDDWDVEPVKDKLTQIEVKELKNKYSLNIDVRKQWYGSLRVACELFNRARTENKSILFYVHGYNNDVDDVLKASVELEELYNVIVLPFTWPANGGGVISGTASYLSDKSDARASSGALNYAIAKIQQFHLLLTNSLKTNLMSKAQLKHPDNNEAAANLFTKLMEKECKVKLTLFCHSMGNYLFKHTLTTSENSTSKLIFDNICLVAADANNFEHVFWVKQLDVRKRIYIVINENDYALRVSRIKPGEVQKARLGHYISQLNSPNAHYLDVTKAKHVNSDHAYFKGDAVKKDDKLKEMFYGMFNGNSVEETLVYHADNNTYKIK